MTNNRWDADALARFSDSVFMALGLCAQDADRVSRNLIYADLAGVSTHGVARIPSYVERLKRGMAKAAPAITVETKFPWSLVMDGDNAMGAVVGGRAADEVRAKALALGIGAATVRHSNHFGAAGFYSRAMAGGDCIAICLSPASKSLAPFGSQEPLLGTNPWSVSIPAGKYGSWTMDMATSVAARGHIRLAAKTGKAIPGDWALDDEGRPTTDPAAALRGVMLPFAGSKGSAIAMMVDILGGVLAGSAFGGGIRDMNVDFEAPQNVGHFFMAFQVAAFLPLADFRQRMETLIERLKSLKPAAGFAEVMFPGEPEMRAEASNRRDGIALPPEVAAGLKGTAEELGLAFPVPR